MPRNASGIYSLPNPPRIPLTVITSLDENQTRDDIAAALTESLDRYGRGGMLAPMRFADGTIAAPGIAWLSEASMGFYRAGTNDMRLAIASTDIQQWTPAATYIGNPLTVSGGFTLSGNATITGTALIQGATTIDDTLTVTGNANFLGALALAGSLSASQISISTGSLYLPNTQGVYWRNAANTNYYVGSYVTASDQIVFGSTWTTLHLYAASVPKIVLSATEVQLMDGVGVAEVSITTGITRLSGNLYFGNQRGIYIKDSGGTDMAAFAGNSSNELVYGVGASWLRHYFFCAGVIRLSVEATAVTVSTLLTTTGNINCAGALNVLGAVSFATTLIIGSTLTVSATSAGNYVAFIYNSAAAVPYGMDFVFGSFLAGSRGYGNYYADMRDTGGAVFAFPTNGGLLNFASLNVDISDARVKSDIDAGYDFTPFVEKLVYKRFKYKDMEQVGEVIGLVAQDVEQYAPELVVDEALNGMKGIQYQQIQARINSIIPRLIARIKQLEARP